MMNNVSVEIAGSTYQLKTDDDPEYLKQLANSVTVKILEIKRETNASSVDCAAMAALDFADKFYKEQMKKKPAAKKKAAAEEPEPTTLI